MVISSEVAKPPRIPNQKAASIIGKKYASLKKT
jgi:hypothetical protein